MQTLFETETPTITPAVSDLLISVGRGYQAVYADPPWGDGKSGPPQTSKQSAYSTMRVTDVAALPVGRIIHWDAALFMWATFPRIEEAMYVMKAWGFTYVTVAFVWVKLTTVSQKVFMGMGAWSRSNAEVVLLGTHGEPARVSKAVSQIVMQPVSEHSKKPHEVRRRIVELMGDVLRIELFARERVEGWDVWGNEVSCDVELVANEHGAACDRSAHTASREHQPAGTMCASVARY